MGFHRILALTAIGLLAACSQVPNDVLPANSGLSAADNAKYERLVREARGAFLVNTRTIEGVQKSHDLYAQALALRSNEYEPLWEAARTAIWLGNFGPEENQEKWVRDGIRYANTALEINPDGEEALFYDGALAGKLAELDISFGKDGLDTIMKRMKQLIDMGSTYIYGGPQRVLATVLMRAPGAPIGPGDWDEAEKHMNGAMKVDPNWPENQLHMAELEFGLADERDKPELAEQARKRLNEHFLGDDAKAPMGSGFEFERWKADARKLMQDNKD